MYLYREKWSQKLFKLLDIPWIFTWLLQVVFNTIHAHSLFRAYNGVYFSLTGILIWHSLFHEYYLLPRYFIRVSIIFPGFRSTGRFLKIIYHLKFGWYFIHIGRAVAPRAIWMKSTLLNQLNVSKWPGQQRLNASPFKLFPGFKQRVKAMLLANEFVWLFHEFSRESFRLYRARGGLDQRSAVFIIGKRCENFLFNLRPNFVSKSNL